LIIGAISGYQYGFNGLIDEVNIFNRGLAPSEIKALVAAASAGECVFPLLLSVSPNSAQAGQESLSVLVTGRFTHFAP
jgi:hypothetical protein